MEFTNATVQAKANVYFEGRVISHTLVTSAGDHKTIGIILPGSYHFGTGKAERMHLIEGKAQVVIDGNEHPRAYSVGEAFEVPANSGFTITVHGEPCHYVCSFLD